MALKPLHANDNIPLPAMTVGCMEVLIAGCRPKVVSVPRPEHWSCCRRGSAKLSRCTGDSRTISGLCCIRYSASGDVKPRTRSPSLRFYAGGSPIAATLYRDGGVRDESRSGMMPPDRLLVKVPLRRDNRGRAESGFEHYQSKLGIVVTCSDLLEARTLAGSEQCRPRTRR